MEHVPRAVSQRLLERGKRAKAVVVVFKGGKPSRVYDVQTYLRRIEQTKKHQPWKHRKQQEPPDPLGAVDGRVISSLRREHIYE